MIVVMSCCRVRVEVEVVALSSTERSPVVLGILRKGGGSRRIPYMRYATRRFSAMSSKGESSRWRCKGGRSRRSAPAGRGIIDSSPLCQSFRLDDASR